MKHLYLLLFFISLYSSFSYAQGETQLNFGNNEAKRISYLIEKYEPVYIESIKNLIQNVVFTKECPELKKDSKFIDKLKIKVIPFFYISERIDSLTKIVTFFELLELDTIKYQYLAYCFQDSNLVLFISFHKNCNVLNLGGGELDYNYEFELYDSNSELNKYKNGLINYLNYYKVLFEKNYQLFYLSGMYSDGIFFIDKNTNKIGLLNKNEKKDIIENPNDYFLNPKKLNYLKNISKECNTFKQYDQNGTDNK